MATWRNFGIARAENAVNRAAQADYNQCLEDRIIDQFKHHAPDLKFYGEPEDNRSTVEKAREQLELLRTPIQWLYSWIYNANPGCDPSCGTMYDSIHLFANGRVLEQMLKDIVAQRIEYGF